MVVITLVRRFWHSLHAVEALFIRPSSEGPPPLLPSGNWPPTPPPEGVVRGAIGLKARPTSPIELDSG